MGHPDQPEPAQKGRSLTRSGLGSDAGDHFGRHRKRWTSCPQFACARADARSFAFWRASTSSALLILERPAIPSRVASS